MSTEPKAKRLASKVSVDRTTGCWLWTDKPERNGYARLTYGGRRQLAHRASYEIFVGPIPDGLVLDHLCRTRHCVNPAHLEPVTRGENVLRGVGITATNARKKFCERGHPYDETNTRIDPSGKRRCRACGCINQQAYLARRAA